MRNPAKKQSTRAKGNAKNGYQGPSSGEQRSALILKTVLNALGKRKKEFKKRGGYLYVGLISISTNIKALIRSFLVDAV